ncbi:MAG TPA: phosphatidylglycerophosphatase A [Myxococcota bacterium]|nr:phosphatidylglycerophosphatase A [Myxococcota bacterium]
MGPRDRSHTSPPFEGPLRLAFHVATVAGIGRAPAAPGTAGAAFATAVFVLLSLLPRGAAVVLLGVASAAAFAAGVWAAGRLGAATGREDDGCIVIDEVVGQWLALAPLLVVPGWRFAWDAPGLAPLVSGFVAFRVFDIWKPGPVGWAERRFAGGLGVMMDDVVAGALGAVALAAGLALLGGAR